MLNTNTVRYYKNTQLCFTQQCILYYCSLMIVGNIEPKQYYNQQNCNM